MDEGYPQCEEIWLVQDNLNTHHASSLYKAFEPAQAERIMRGIRWIYTPKHASWLNMAEIEIGVFERQCLARRIGSREELAQQVAALEAERNAARATINWQFTCEQARTTLQRLYLSYWSSPHKYKDLLDSSLSEAKNIYLHYIGR